MLSNVPLLILIAVVACNVAKAHYGLMHPNDRREQSSAFCKRDLSTLRQLIVVFRYGDITPVTTFPNDIYHEHSWPSGFGQLTRRGVERSYELGLWTRHCYDSFLHKNVSPKRVYARSTDYDRTLMSAQAHIAGVYPPMGGFQTGSQKWGETSAYKLGQYWQPFPVHTVPARYDRLLRGNLNCPRFDELTTEIDFAKKTKKLMARHKRFLEKLAYKSGIKSEDLVKVVSIVESAVLVEVENGRVPVDWLNSEHDLELLAYFRDLIVGLYFRNPELTRLVSGKLVQEILNRLLERASGKSSFEHLLYAGHSTVMEGLLASLGVLHSIGHREPPYGSAILFELHQMQDHSYAVAAYYRNSSTHDPIPLTIPGCHIRQEPFSDESDESGDSFAKPSDEEKHSQKEKQHGGDKKGSEKHDGKKSKKSRRWHYSKEELYQKRRLTWCKLKDFKKALAKKTTQNHDADCRPRLPPRHAPKKFAKEEQPKKKPIQELKEGKKKIYVEKDKVSKRSEESKEYDKKPSYLPYHDQKEKKRRSHESRESLERRHRRFPSYHYDSREHDKSREGKDKKVTVYVKKNGKSGESRERHRPYYYEPSRRYWKDRSYESHGKSREVRLHVKKSAESKERYGRRAYFDHHYDDSYSKERSASGGWYGHSDEASYYDYTSRQHGGCKGGHGGNVGRPAPAAPSAPAVAGPAAPIAPSQPSQQADNMNINQMPIQQASI